MGGWVEGEGKRGVYGFEFARGGWVGGGMGGWVGGRMGGERGMGDDDVF